MSAVALPDTKTLLLRAHGPVLHVTLHRPDKRNAMSLAMVDELEAALDHVEAAGTRIVVFRGSNGNFCSGGDISDMAAASAQPGTAPSDNTNPKTTFILGGLFLDWVQFSYLKLIEYVFCSVNLMSHNK